MLLSRISIVTETYAPEINGVANTLNQLVKGLRLKGIAVQVIRPKQNRSDISLIQADDENITLAGLPIPGYQALKFGLPAKSSLRKALKRFQPHAIYVATEGPMGWVSASLGKELNVPVMSGFHTNFHQYIEHYHMKWLQGFAYRYLRKFHNRTQGTLVPTAMQQKELIAYGFDNVQVLSRGVDSQLFSPEKRDKNLRRQWGLKDTDVALLYVGRIAAEKNIALAFETYQQLKGAEDNLKLIMVGDGPLLADLKEQYPDVIFTGLQRDEALARHYASADIFLFPSKTDTFGNVVTEAMASGLAVVSFDYAAGREHIIDQQSGMLADFDQSKMFIQHVENLLDRPNQLQNIRKLARLHSKQICWQNIVEQFIVQLNSIQFENICYATNKSRISVS